MPGGITLISIFFLVSHTQLSLLKVLHNFKTFCMQEKILFITCNQGRLCCLPGQSCYAHQEESRWSSGLAVVKVRRGNGSRSFVMQLRVRLEKSHGVLNRFGWWWECVSEPINHSHSAVSCFFYYVRICSGCIACLHVSSVWHTSKKMSTIWVTFEFGTMTSRHTLRVA